MPTTSRKLPPGWLLICATGLGCGDDSVAPQHGAALSDAGAGVIVFDAAAPNATGGNSGAPGFGSTLPGTQPVGGDAGQAGASVGPPPTGVSYHKNIRALLETHCIDCHVQGGIGPLPFESWSSVQPVAETIVSAVESGKMPPTFWNGSCQPLADDRSLAPADRALFTAWKTNKYAEGKPSDYVPPPPRAKVELGAPSIMMSTGLSYTPPDRADEYRCFVLGQLDQDTYLTGMQILPGVAAEVHHIQIHRIDAAQRSALLQRDQADPKPGYVCSGGTGVDSQNMFSYRPGSGPVSFLKGDAAFMAAGSTLLIQVHYNTVFLPSGQAPTGDESKIALWTLADGELPDRVIYRTTVFGPVDLPPGDTSVVSTVTTPMSQLSSFGGFFGVGGTFVPGEIIGMTPHAHQLATHMWAGLSRADGSMACLDDVPNWDFQWQFDYLYVNGVPYGPDDQLTGNCEYDNGPDNQPVIDGVKQQPRQVAFGERSVDEMCQHYIWLRFARDAFLAARKPMTGF